jgi:bifunctional non-homologous end joining protein LigD
LANILARAGHGIWFNDHATGRPCSSTPASLGLEGIVSKRKDSPYRSGRSPDWLKMKNPACAAVKREEEEDWGR